MKLIKTMKIKAQRVYLTVEGIYPIEDEIGTLDEVETARSNLKVRTQPEMKTQRKVRSQLTPVAIKQDRKRLENTH